MYCIYALMFRGWLTSCAAPSAADSALEPFVNEIELLQKLKGKDNIIQLIDHAVDRPNNMIYMVFEYGEIDLHHKLLERKGKPFDHIYTRYRICRLIAPASGAVY